MVGCLMKLMGIAPLVILVHIRMTWMKDMRDRPNICDVRGETISGTIAGDEPPPPPQTMFAYYFQFNTKYCISLHRATYLFDDLSKRNC